MKKYHFFYKTTCSITNKCYYGVHSTHDLNDGYIGSGKLLHEDIRKYGKEHFKCEHLKFFDSSKDAFKYEEAFVDEAIINSESTYNIAIGGQGGFLGYDAHKRAAQKLMNKPKTKEHREKLSHATKEWYKNVGDSNETKLKKSLSHKGVPLSDEHAKSIREGKAKNKSQCPYCKNYFDKSNLTRWHGNKCKLFKG